MRITRKNRDIAMNPHLVFVLCVQPRIREKMGQKQSLQGNGALERSIYLVPHSCVGYRTHNQAPQRAKYIESYGALIDSLLSVERIYDNHGTIKPRTIKLSDTAYQTFRDFQCWLEPQLKPDGELYAIPGWAGKIAGFTLRIAGISHVVSGNDENTLISEDTMHCSIQIAKGLIQRAKTAFLLMGWEDHLRDAKRIYDWVLSSEKTEFDRSSLTTAMRHHMQAKQIDAALPELVDRHILRERPIFDGQSKKIYDVNPTLFAS